MASVSEVAHKRYKFVGIFDCYHMSIVVHRSPLRVQNWGAAFNKSLSIATQGLISSLDQTIGADITASKKTAAPGGRKCSDLATNV